MTDDGWAGMSEELFEKVLEVLQPAGPSKPNDGGLGFSQTLAAVRLVCAGWKKIHDAMVTRLVLRYQTTDEAVGMLVLRFPAVVSVEVKGGPFQTAALTDKGLRAVSSLASLTFLDLSWCRNVTDEGMRAVRNCTALKSLNLFWCDKVTDEGMRAVSSLPALTFLDISCCNNVANEGLRALSNCTTLTELSLRFCDKVMDEGVRALSSLPALTSIDLRNCNTVTAAGVQALRTTTAAPNLHIIR